MSLAIHRSVRGGSTALVSVMQLKTVCSDKKDPARRQQQWAIQREPKAGQKVEPSPRTSTPVLGRRMPPRSTVARTSR